MIQTTQSFFEAYGAMVTADTILPGRLQPQRVRISDIRDEVCMRRGVSLSEIMSRNRVHRIAHARQEVMWLAREAGKSTVEIGRFFGFDHTTVLHGCRAHERRMSA